MEGQERKRKGDVYREVKVGAVVEATRGPERSGTGARRVCGSSRAQARCGSSRESGRQGLAALCPGCQVWAAAGAPVGGLGGWSRLDLAVGGRTLCRSRANRGHLACPRTCLEGSPSGLWGKHAGGKRLG